MRMRISNHNLQHPDSSENKRTSSDYSSIILRFVRSLERLSVRSKLFRHLYERLFYRTLVRREMASAQLKPQSRILHIGCGSLPFTPLALAHSGASVTAIDVNASAAERAKHIVASEGLSSVITIVHGDGLTYDPRGFDAVWVSLHAAPKENIISSLLKRMDEGSVLVYRNPRGWLRLWYSRCLHPARRKVIKQHFGKESVIIEKTQSPPHVPLSELYPGASGVIVHIPDHPLLSPLGFRPGKHITVTSRCMLGGPVVAEIEGRNSAIHRSLAREVHILPKDRTA